MHRRALGPLVAPLNANANAFTSPPVEVWPWAWGVLKGTGWGVGKNLAGKREFLGGKKGGEGGRGGGGRGGDSGEQGGGGGGRGRYGWRRQSLMCAVGG